MRNDECIIKFVNKDGRVLQSFQRDKDGWFETSSKGIVRRCTAEQTLSHLLPPLAGVSSAIVKVEKITSKKSSPLKLKPIIEVPTKLLPTWLNSAFVYGLDSSTIGVSGRAVPEWAEISCFAEETPITRDAEKVVVQIPERIKRFYSFEQKHGVVSVNGNNLLITISGNVVEDKKYPA